MSFFDKWNAAGELVNAYNDLPPTYQTGETGKFSQVIPDQHSNPAIGHKLDRVNQAENEFNKTFNKKK